MNETPDDIDVWECPHCGVHVKARIAVIQSLARAHIEHKHTPKQY